MYDYNIRDRVNVGKDLIIIYSDFYDNSEDDRDGDIDNVYDEDKYYF